MLSDEGSQREHARQRAKIEQLEDVSQTVEPQDVLQRKANLTTDNGILRYTDTRLITITVKAIEGLATHLADLEQAAIQSNYAPRLLTRRHAKTFSAAVLALYRQV